MKKTLANLLLGLSLVSLNFTSHADESVSSKWLSTIDSGNYEQSWQEADQFFQSELSKGSWANALNTVRKPLGKVLTREEIKRENHTALPGVPKGEYMIIQYQTSFAKKSTAIETVTLTKNNGQWRPVGYFIK